MNPGEQAPLKLLIRGFGVRIPGGAPAETPCHDLCPWGVSWGERRFRPYHDLMGRAASGHVEQLPSGAFRVEVHAGTDPLTGRRLRFRQTVKTEKQAQIVLGRLLEQASAGQQPDSGVTVPDAGHTRDEHVTRSPSQRACPGKRPALVTEVMI
jgi:hypothetical protein